MGCCHPQNSLSIDYPKPLSESSSKKLILSTSDFIPIKTCPISDTYAIQGLISRGNLSQTHKAIHIPSNSPRAIKTVPLPTDPLLIRTLLQEISILKRIDHPGIVKIFEIFQNTPKLYIVTELFTGGELFDRIKEMKKFSENQAAKCIKEVAGALIHCHQQGIVHGDLIPENILYENKEETAKLKLIGFGNSLYYYNKPADEINYYKSPESLGGKATEKGDVWSLGVILYILLSGSPPFVGKNLVEIAENIKTGTLSFTSQNWNGISEESKELLSKMLNKTPKNRCTIEEVFHNYWVKMRSCDLLPDKKLQESALSALCSFKFESYLQKAVLTFIISQRKQSETYSKLREVFESIDKNGDGLLSFDELQLAVVESKLDFNVKEIIEEIDIDCSGFIDYTEFLMATVDRSTVYGKQRIKEVFNELDTNNDGKISAKELKVMLSGDRERISYINQIMKESDIDGDGEIDINEFMAQFEKFFVA